jgi:hypothetical protein
LRAAGYLPSSPRNDCDSHQSPSCEPSQTELPIFI